MVGVPALVLRRLDELGDRGRRWLDRGGQAAIVKVAIPSGGEGYSEFERELLVLTLAKHPSYVDVLEADVDRRALLLERLGQPLTDAAMTVEAQIEILAATMMDGWRRVESTVALPTGYEQGVGLGEFIQRQWVELDQPCSRQVTRRALDFVDNRLAGFDLSAAPVS